MAFGRFKTALVYPTYILAWAFGGYVKTYLNAAPDCTGG
jgi:hypothetical protein